MIQFPLNDGTLVVLEPGNFERLRAGRPLKIGNVMIAFTPDMEHFVKSLGVSTPLPSKGERIECHVQLTPEQIDAALKSCQKRAEVNR